MFTLPFISIVDCDVFVENPIDPATGSWISTINTDVTKTVNKIDLIGKKQCCGEETTFDTISVIEVPFDLDFNFDGADCAAPVWPIPLGETITVSGTLDNVDTYQASVTRGGTVVYTTAETNNEHINFLIAEYQAIVPGDIITVTVTLTNDVVITLTKTIDAHDFQNCATVYTGTVSRSVTYPYTIENNLIKIDTDTYAFEDGVWTLRYVIYYTQNGTDYTETTDKCYLIDCVTTCKFAQDSPNLIKNNKDFFIEVGIAKQSLDTAISCQHCCEACELFEFYKTAVNYGKLSPCNC